MKKAKSKTMKKLLLIIGVFFISNFEVKAQKLKGTWGFQTYPSRNQVCVYGDKISNDNTGGCTGTLKIALYATGSPYNGGSIYGYCLFEKQMDPLKGGFYYYDINKVGSLSCPPGGYYCMTILLLEYNNGYKIVDWVSMPNSSKF